MPTLDPFVDAYIDKSQDFAKPILRHIRQLVHEACPDVVETKKWSFPHFDYKGMMCSMAAFKEHCAFGFWKAPLVLGDAAKREAMGHFGCLTTVKDLPPKREFIALVKKAAQLNEQGVKLLRPRRGPRREVETPDDLAAALKKDKKAQSAFEKFPPSHRHEYIEWITEAKTEGTRQRRLDQAVEWMSEGKPRNWKYMRKS